MLLFILYIEYDISNNSYIVFLLYKFNMKKINKNIWDITGLIGGRDSPTIY